MVLRLIKRGLRFRVVSFSCWVYLEVLVLIGFITVPITVLVTILGHLRGL